MIVSLQIEGTLYSFREPETAAEVLHWVVRVSAHLLADDFLARAVDFAANYLELIDRQAVSRVAAIGHLTELAKNKPEELGLLCNGIVESASLPPEFLKQYQTLLLRDAGPKLEKFKPPRWCKCPRCSGQNPDADETVCLFYGISPAVTRTMEALLGLDEAGAMLDKPFWFLQLKAEHARAQSRKEQFSQEQKRKQKETEDAWDAQMPGWRERRH